MEYLALFNFILFNLLQNNIKDILVLHCWQTNVALPMEQLLSRNDIYSQYIDLGREQNTVDFATRYLTSKVPRTAVYLELGCQRAEYIINQTSQAALFTQRYHWLMLDYSEDVEQMEILFGEVNLGINADISYVRVDQEFEDSSIFTLYDIYNPGSHLGGHLNITEDQIVHCNSSECHVEQYLSDLNRGLRLHHRLNLSEVTFRIAAVINAISLNTTEENLIEYLKSQNMPHMDWLSRFGHHMISHVQEILGFKIHYLWFDNWSLNDTSGAAVGALITESAELCTSPFVTSPGRLQYIRPLVEQSQFRSICIFITPHNIVIKPSILLKPFDPSVWYAFLVLLIFVGFLLWVTFQLELRWLHQCIRFQPSLLTTCMVSFGAACAQGATFIPRSTGGRMTFLALFITSILMYNYYTSMVVSSLLGAPVRSDITTIQQLADSPLDVAFEPLSFTKIYLQTSPRSDIRSLVKQKVETKRDPNNNWLSAKDGTLMVRDHRGFVFVSEASYIYYFVEKYYEPSDICELHEIPFRPESYVYTTIHINSTYRELMKQIYFRFVETGILLRYRNIYVKSKLHCFANKRVINVGLNYTAPLFLALFFAYFLALGILLIELACHWYAKRQPNNM